METKQQSYGKRLEEVSKVRALVAQERLLLCAFGTQFLPALVEHLVYQHLIISDEKHDRQITLGDGRSRADLDSR